MTTRQLVPDSTPESEVLSSGYNNGNDLESTEIIVPSCGIEDIDWGIFTLFDQELGFTVQKIQSGGNRAVDVNKPIVIFATGERFAVVKRLRPVRDRNGALMLPAISIRRTGVEQSLDIMGSRGMNQQSGNIIIKKQLDSSDRNYQNIINKLGLKNAELVNSSRTTGDSNNEKSIQEGMLLDIAHNSNIVQIITIPQPQFIKVTYEIVFWTSFGQHMNYMIETLLTSQLPQNKTFRLSNPNNKDYWFMAFVDDSIQSQDNFEDFTEKERIVRYSFTMHVDGYIVAPNGPGNKNPFKSYVSATELSFDISDQTPEKKLDVEKTKNMGKFVLTDISADSEVSQKPTIESKFLYVKETINPKTGKKIIGYVSVMDSNQKKGETVYTVSDKKTLENYFIDLNKNAHK